MKRLSVQTAQSGVPNLFIESMAEMQHNASWQSEGWGAIELEAECNTKG